MQEKEFLACQNKNHQKHVKIEWLDYSSPFSTRVIETTEGITTSGTIDIKNDGSYRRSCKLTMVLTDRTKVRPTSLLWVNRRFRLWIGIDYLGEVIWFNFGIYYLRNPEVMVKPSEQTVSIEGVDMMWVFEHNQNQYKTVIEADGYVNEAIKSIFNEQGFYDLILEPNNYKVPYKIEKSLTYNYWATLTELRDLYSTYELFVNVAGQVVYRRIKQFKSDSIVFDFSKHMDLVIGDSGYKHPYSTDNIYNSIRVEGKLHNDKSQYSKVVELHDAKNPYSIEKIGKNELGISNDKLYTQEQVNDEADYQLLAHTNFNEKLDFSCLPQYYFDVNQKIRFKDENDNLADWLIDSISMDLRFDGVMNITAHKIYAELLTT